MEQNNNQNRKSFIQKTTLVGAGAVLIGGIPETQEVMDYCADNKIYPQIQLISADQINDAWDKVVNKEARYRFVIDASTF